MRQVILVFAVFAVVAIGVIAFATRNGMRVVRPPNIGLVQGSSCMVYQVEDDQHCVVVSLPSGWFSSGQSMSGGSSYYRASATFGDRSKGGNLSATVRRDSFSPSVVFIEEHPFQLTNGAVFRIRPAKSKTPLAGVDRFTTSGGVEIIQLPFDPLDVNGDYVDQLNEYFTKQEKD